MTSLVFVTQSDRRGQIQSHPGSFVELLLEELARMIRRKTRRTIALPCCVSARHLSPSLRGNETGEEVCITSHDFTSLSLTLRRKLSLSNALLRPFSLRGRTSAHVVLLQDTGQPRPTATSRAVAQSACLL